MLKTKNIAPWSLTISWIVVWGFCWQSTAFLNRYPVQIATPPSLPALCSSKSSADDLSNETPEERAERMKLVRQIQATFYKDDADDSDDENPQQQSPRRLVEVDTSQDDTLTNVPLFRVQWTELIGFQNVLNIHEPHYTHMFRRIIQGPKPWRYGHIFLPNGSKNLNNPTYRYDNPNNKATRVGTLMQITDVMEDEDSGRLGLVVQAIERFEISDVTQHEPYTIATVTLLPDEEFCPTNLDDQKKGSSAKVLNELEKWYEWENYPTLYNDCIDQEVDGGQTLRVTPLVNYNSEFFADEISIGVGDDDDEFSDDVPMDNQLVAELEYKVWISLDELLRVLGEASGMRVPIPSQLLGLLPKELPKGLEEHGWPEQFRIEQFAQELQQRNAEIGTYTKSPFLRVAENYNYPSLRRARRFSYVVWILLDSILGLLGPQAVPNRQGLLECMTISERLSAAYEQLEQINSVLRQKRL